MLRPSAVIASIAGMPSGVAGIFTSRLGWVMRSCRSRAAAMVALVSRASSGATSMDTKPSVPPAAANVGRSTARAWATSSTTSSQ